MSGWINNHRLDKNGVLDFSGEKATIEDRSVCVYRCVCIYIYIYIERERERERKTEIHREIDYKKLM